MYILLISFRDLLRKSIDSLALINFFFFAEESISSRLIGHTLPAQGKDWHHLSSTAT